MTPATVIAFLGAGSVEFTQHLLTDLASWDDEMAMTWRLHDIDPERLEVAVGVAQRLRAERGLKAAVEAHPDRSTALDGADAVVGHGHGGRSGSHPRRPGDTAAARTSPARSGTLSASAASSVACGPLASTPTLPPTYVACARTPGSSTTPTRWRYNVGLLDRIAPELNVLGLCHSVHWTMDTLSSMVDVPLAEMRFTAAGVNHQAWVLTWEKNNGNPPLPPPR